MKKRILIILAITLTLVLCLASCGEKTHTVHTFGEWVVDTEATCTANGSQSQTCTECGEVKTQTIPSTGHIESDWIVDKVWLWAHIPGSWR